MQIKETDINNFRGIESNLYKLDNAEHMRKVTDILRGRAVSIGCYLISSNQTEVVGYDSDKNEFLFCEEVMEGLYKHIATVKFSCVKDVYIHISEEVLIQGVSKDEEGNLQSADVVGINAQIYEYEGHRELEYNEEKYKGIHREELEDMWFYNAGRYMSMEKGEEGKYISL